MPFCSTYLQSETEHSTIHKLCRRKKYKINVQMYYTYKLKVFYLMKI